MRLFWLCESCLAPEIGLSVRYQFRTPLSPPSPIESIFWDLDLGSKFLRQDSEITLPRGPVSVLPFSPKKSWERSVSGLRALCYRPFPEGYLRTLRRTGPGPNLCSDPCALNLSFGQCSQEIKVKANKHPKLVKLLFPRKIDRKSIQQGRCTSTVFHPETNCHS